MRPDSGGGESARGLRQGNCDHVLEAQKRDVLMVYGDDIAALLKVQRAQNQDTTNSHPRVSVSARQLSRHEKESKSQYDGS